MKIAFLADTHFGFTRFEKDANQQGEAAIYDACKNADVLLLGGDIFDHRIPKLETIAHVAQILQKAQTLLPNNGFDKIYAIHGTHEMRSKDSLNPIAMMARLNLLVDVHNITKTIQKDNKKVAISGMGGIPDDLVSLALPKLNCKPIENALNIFMIHQTLQEFIPQAKNLASIEDLPKDYDFYLCGHIHTKKEYAHGKVLIVGSTVITQLRDEDQQEKGYYLIDSDTKKAEFIKIKTRPFFCNTLEFENAKPQDIRIKIESHILEFLNKEFEQKPILRIILKGTLESTVDDIDLSGYDTDKAQIFIDNHLEGNSLFDEIKKIKGDQIEKATPDELGLKILIENAKTANMDPKRAKELFEKYSD